MRRILALFVALLMLAPVATSADEGMWTIDHFPVAKVAKAYGFTATPAFLDHVRASSVRLPGCSGSFVSHDALIMTNHHCARGCVQALSDPQHDFIADGFYAKSPQDERACPGFQINSLLSITHVTKQVTAATAGAAGADYNAKQRAVFGSIESACSNGDPVIQCQVVSLYHGGIYDLYRYKKYTDVRLVFAPEETIAFFGGDPDNFTFPRYDLDCAFLRAYENGKPATPPDYFRWSPAGTKDGDLVFVPGNPGSTARLLTLSELETTRDVAMPRTLRSLSELRGLLTQFSSESPEHARIARNTLFGIENGLKGNWGREEQLLDPTFMARKAAAERAERAAIARNPALRAKFAGAWDAIAQAEHHARDLSLAYTFREASGAPGAYLGTARTLVRAATERAKPNAQRLREFQDAALPLVQARLAAPVPVYPDLERVTLTHNLTKMREWLGADDPYVRALLGNDAPQTVADRIVSGSKLGDPAVRKALYDGGPAAIAASTDPAIVLMRSVDDASRAIRKQYEDEVQAPLRVNDEKVAQADFALHGLSTYPGRHVHAARELCVGARLSGERAHDRAVHDDRRRVPPCHGQRSVRAAEELARRAQHGESRHAAGFRDDRRHHRRQFGQPRDRRERARRRADLRRQHRVARRRLRLRHPAEPRRRGRLARAARSAARRLSRRPRRRRARYSGRLSRSATSRATSGSGSVMTCVCRESVWSPWPPLTSSCIDVTASTRAQRSPTRHTGSARSLHSNTISPRRSTSVGTSSRRVA